ncbi:CAP-Gly domain-containing linker protein 4-like isoform X2 [Clavelina lepadiformis]|uniref:CAP-Gly domain-containing linker protein 4-like isoform X2 n=1 Tax=Clavelina lepadiformis TaxID=159417 RepID=UPI0040430CD9
MMEDCCLPPTDAAYKSEAEKVDEDLEILSIGSDVNADIFVHPVADIPLPSEIEEKENEIVFLDPSIGEGKRLMNDKRTTIPQLFAIMRQFIGPLCSNIGIVVDEMLRRGIGINDVDSTTGMTMLHYAIRASALAEKSGLAVVKRLLSNGADPCQRSLYTDMNALHMAAYFDVASIARLLVKECDLWPSVPVDSLCDSYEYGTSLHISSSCLSVKTLEILLQKGASCNAKDDLNRTPEECLPHNLVNIEQEKRSNQIRELLHRYNESPRSASKHSSGSDSTKLSVGMHVNFQIERPSGREKSKLVTMFGIIRYLGSLPPSVDDWAGIELDYAEGKNDGSFEGKTYFRCKKDHGIFVQTSRVSPLFSGRRVNKKRVSRKKDMSKNSSRRRSSSQCEYVVGNRVLVAGSLAGTVRYVGTTQFASGVWCGVELDKEGPGRNDGSVGGISYFRCPSSRGVFAPPSKISHNLEQVSSKLEDLEPLTSQVSSTSKTFVKGQSTSTASRQAKPAEAKPKSQELASTKSAPSTPDMLQKRKDMSENRTDSASSTPVTRRRSAQAGKTSYLRPGLRVDVCGTKQTAIVKFIGMTSFAPGLWVGLDLGAARGRNDGSVKGRRYFTCPPKHGIMLRPSRITHRGFNGDQILPANLLSSCGNDK